MYIYIGDAEFVDHTASTLGYFDFVHKELVQFSYAHVQRSIPSVVDGLKPGQRKVLFACFKRKLSSEIKVAQLAGYVAEHTAYHHGEASLHGAFLYIHELTLLTLLQQPTQATIYIIYVYIYIYIHTSTYATYNQYSVG